MSSCAKTLGIGVSTAMQAMVPSAMPARTSRRPSRSMASVRVSFMTSRTSGWSGISMSPVMVSGQAEAWGKTLAKRSSERVRWIWGATRLPFCMRRSWRLRPAAQRQRFLKSGEGMLACSRSSRAVRVVRKWKTSASGKLCCSAREMLMPLSVAAACSSKLKPRQKRLRRASPQALLRRPPKGAWRMSCWPPPSSKKRSAMRVVLVGTAPRTARPWTM